jgi:hypothetical protein
MSIFKVNQTDFQSVTIATNPFRHYSSSSSGVTGSVYVFARRSEIEKEVTPLSSFVESAHNDSDLASTLESIKNIAKSKNNSSLSNSNIFSQLDSYLKAATAQSVSAKKQKTLDVIRFTPSFNFTSNTLRKSVIKDNLSDYYRSAYPSSHWAYSNYNCLNFFSSSTVTTSSVLLYPNDDNGIIHEGYSYGRYALSGAFSFDFYINPRYKTLDSNGHFNAGTIFHLSSSYALSLITGSLKDENGLPAAFRLQLQLSHSADVSPSSAKFGSYPRNLIFLSEDNALKWNNWHHVVVRWGTDSVNHGTGSFNIDGFDKGTFVISSGTVAPRVYPDTGMSPTNPDVLCFGNYYEGTNSGNNELKRFFSTDPATRDGLVTLKNTTSINVPDHYSFNHPLRAELHDVSIKQFYVTNPDIVASSSTGLSNVNQDSGVCFYVPPFFVESSPIRRFVGDHGGILQTPFLEVDGTTADPFNIAMSFGVGGHYINTENFLKDFASGHHPRQHHLTGVAIDTTTDAKSANEFLYDQKFVRKRNLTILPCDDGNFYPNYDLLMLEPLKNVYVDDLNNFTIGFITLNNMLSTSSLLFNTSFENSQKTADQANSFADESIGFSPEKPSGTPGSSFKNYLNSINKSISSGDFNQGLQENAPLAIFQRTQDSSSNQVVFFDISNLYYGLRILPGSFTISDSSLSGSGGEIKITIKDDCNGTLYRANSTTPHAVWNSVGTIFYNEGIVAIKSPHLYFFGQHQYEMSFKGEQNIHVLRFESIAPVNYLNSSSNPTFKTLPSSLKPNEQDLNYVYVSGINFHDDNLNVVMKTQLAQPIMKKHSEKLLFKVKYDF